MKLEILRNGNCELKIGSLEFWTSWKGTHHPYTQTRTYIGWGKWLKISIIDTPNTQYPIPNEN